MSRAPVILRMSDVEPVRVDWLWPGRIPNGKLTILDGDPDRGKSLASVDLAARVTTGAPMPSSKRKRKPAGVIMLVAEDGAADTVRPRLDVAGADVSRVGILRGHTEKPDSARRKKKKADDDNDGEKPIMLADAGVIEAAIDEYDAALLVIDPLTAFVGPRIDTYRESDMRRALAPLISIAERTNIAIVILRHLRKSGGSAMSSGAGSIAITAAARSVLAVDFDPGDRSRYVLARTKCNLAAPVSSIAYRVELIEHPIAGIVPRVEWLGETEITADALLSERSAAPDPDRSAVAEAKEMIVQALTDGPMSPAALGMRAQVARIRERTYERARAELSRSGAIVSEHIGRRYLWRLAQ